MRFILVCRVCHVSMSLQNFPQQANLHLCWNIFNVGQKRQKMWDQLTYDYPNRVLWDKTGKNLKHKCLIGLLYGTILMEKQEKVSHTYRLICYTYT